MEARTMKMAWLVAAICALAMHGCAADATGVAGEEPKVPRPECLDGKCDGVTEDDGYYEFVVVGSGAGGGPLAASLARAGHRTLLLEAGEHTGGNLTYDIPAFHPQASEDPDLSWSYMVSHYDDPAQATRDTKLVYDARGDAQGVFYPRGATVGGSTAVNAMITIYPHESDWDRLAAITGDDSFRADAMRDYFIRVERNRYLGRLADREGHGFDGWLSVEQPDGALALRDLKIGKIVAAAAFTAGDGLFSDLGQLGGLLRRDLNAAGPERDATTGVFTIPGATDGGRRNGTREHIMATIEAGYPLTLRTRSLVTNVVFADEPAADGTPRAIGVEYIDGRHYRADRRARTEAGMPEKRRVTVTREVILSAGAFNTPQLLMLSGIGPRDELDRHGIPVRVELPGVGRNLQDRYEVGVVTEASSDYRLLSGCSFDVGANDACMREWERGGGPYATNGGVVGLVHESSVAAHDPDLFIFGVGGFFKGYYPGYSADVSASKRLFTWVILKGHTRNRAGSVTLRSRDPRDTPLIDFAYFEEGGDADLEAMVQGVETVRRIVDKSNDLLLLDEITEVWPGPEAETRGEIAQWVRDEAWGHHASCTAPIGRDGDPMAVLDSRFRVRGTTGLRVVDASVFPEIPGFFIVVPVYMMSEKAADVILADIGEPRDRTFAASPGLAIPDARPEGVVSEIQVADAGPVEQLSVTVHVTHPWRSDLVVTLEHEGREVVLFEREGWDADDLHQTFVVPEFDGMDTAGPWRLRVSDHAPSDQGTLDAWSVNLGTG